MLSKLKIWHFIPIIILLSILFIPRDAESWYLLSYLYIGSFCVLIGVFSLLNYWLAQRSHKLVEKTELRAMKTAQAISKWAIILVIVLRPKPIRNALASIWVDEGLILIFLLMQLTILVLLVITYFRKDTAPNL